MARKGERGILRGEGNLMKCRDCVMFREEDADSPPACWRGEKEEFARGDEEACDRYRPLEIAYKSLQKRNKNNYKIKITKGDYDKGEDIGGAFGWR